MKVYSNPCGCFKWTKSSGHCTLDFPFEEKTSYYNFWNSIDDMMSLLTSNHSHHQAQHYHNHQPNAHPKRAQRAEPILSWLTPLGAVVSVINVTISMCSSGEWLKSYERILVDLPNVTHREEFQVKKTVSGLWSLCYSNMTYELEKHCFSIDYFAKDRYTPDPRDSTMAIPYAVTRAGPLFIVASILLTIGMLSYTSGHLWRSRRIATFVAGIIFIISGLIMLIGIVVYLSVLQSEIGPKLRPKNSLDAPLFSYYYGFGFILVVVGFMSTELTGICAIFWYMYWHQLDWATKATSFNNLNGGGRGTSGGDPGGNNGDCNHSCYLDRGTRSTHRHTSGHHHPYKSRHLDSCQFGLNSPTSGGGGFDDNIFTYSTGSSIKYDCKKHTGRVPPPCDLHNNLNSTSSSSLGRKGKHCHHHRLSSSGPDFYYDDELDMDVPLPPPPPLPRDLTCSTTVDDYCYTLSGDSGNQQRSSGGGGTRERDLRKTTPV